MYPNPLSPPSIVRSLCWFSCGLTAGGYVAFGSWWVVRRSSPPLLACRVRWVSICAWLMVAFPVGGGAWLVQGWSPTAAAGGFRGGSCVRVWEGAFMFWSWARALLGSGFVFGPGWLVLSFVPIAL
ncbi:unnamed protein product [Linum trigynum]|uniref:Transmembrane protein n=1 Tax=Linum trigynum TaxID=586398 RepID=A0AAV2G8S2_9ROSI